MIYIIFYSCMTKPKTLNFQHLIKIVLIGNGTQSDNVFFKKLLIKNVCDKMVFHKCVLYYFRKKYYSKSSMYICNIFPPHSPPILQSGNDLGIWFRIDSWFSKCNDFSKNMAKFEFWLWFEFEGLMNEWNCICHSYYYRFIFTTIQPASICKKQKSTRIYLKNLIILH